MDMIFYWVKDRVKQCQFHVYWGPGFPTFGRLFKNHHYPTHNKRMREIYIHASVRPMNRAGVRDSALRGCVNTQGMAGSSLTHLPRGR
jgi:hypothetical protein